MSTRANIILKDGEDQLFFYRHSDGYPEGTMPTLSKFVALLSSGRIRRDLSQAAGWLVIIGAIEYQTVPPTVFPQAGVRSFERDNDAVGEVLASFEPNDWKVGAYEPTTGIHGDVAYVYTIDINALTITQSPR